MPRFNGPKSLLNASYTKSSSMVKKYDFGLFRGGCGLEIQCNRFGIIMTSSSIYCVNNLKMINNDKLKWTVRQNMPYSE